jgi:predicted RecA/RadA family phage recombinase
MAKNYVQEGKILRLAVPQGTVSGDPVVVGQLAGVALVDRDADGYSQVQLEGVFSLSVKGVDGVGDSAVAVGDAIYYVSADTPPLSKKNTGVLFGYALEAVTAGATATIKVRLKG